MQTKGANSPLTFWLKMKDSILKAENNLSIHKAIICRHGKECSSICPQTLLSTGQSISVHNTVRDRIYYLGNMLSDTYYCHFLQLASSKIKKFVVKIHFPLSAESFAAIYKAVSSTDLMWDRMKIISYFSKLVKKSGFRFLRYKKLTNLIITLY